MFELGNSVHLRHQYKCIDEIPFDFVRRRLSVILSSDDDKAPEFGKIGRFLRRLSGVRLLESRAHVLICKGAVEEVLSECKYFELGNKLRSLNPSRCAEFLAKARDLSEDGLRVIAVAYRDITHAKTSYSIADESDLTLLGFIAFLDPPKDSAGAAITALNQSGVAVKVLTGDNEIITRKICREVGLEIDRIALGPEIEKMTAGELADLVERVTVFAKVSPELKARIVRALHSRGHVVGFLGDGINDSLALKAADVGVSVDTAVDIAKELADIILLEKSLLVLQQGVIEGRKVFGNIVKYVKMGASSNFGSMFSVIGASLFLPFLPMLPI